MKMGKKNGETEYVKRLVSDFEGIIQKYKILNSFSSPSLGFSSSTSIEDLEKLSKIRKELKKLGKIHLIEEEDQKNEIKKERLKVIKDDYSQIEFDGIEYTFHKNMAEAVKLIVDKSKEGINVTIEDFNTNLYKNFSNVGKVFTKKTNNKNIRHAFFINVIKKHSDCLDKGSYKIKLD